MTLKTFVTNFDNVSDLVNKIFCTRLKLHLNLELPQKLSTNKYVSCYILGSLNLQEKDSARNTRIRHIAFDLLLREG